MALDIRTDTGSEQVRDEVEQAVRGALGNRIDSGNWVVTLRRLPQKLGFIVDLSNLDGFMRQWVFGPEDPVAARIAQDLKV
jgi:hypothetical protein